MQTITTLDQAAEAIRTEFPAAHVNEISDTGIEVYLHDDKTGTADMVLIEQNQDEAWGDETDWSVRGGFVADTGQQDMEDVAAVHEALPRAVSEALAYLRNPGH